MSLSPFFRLLRSSSSVHDPLALRVSRTLVYRGLGFHIFDIDFPLKVKVDEIYNLKCKVSEGDYINVAVQPLDPVVARTRIDKKGSSFIRKYFWEIYQKLGKLNIGKIGEADSWWVNAKEFCDVLKELTKLGITIYSTEEELKKKRLYPLDINRISTS